MSGEEVLGSSCPLQPHLSLQGHLGRRNLRWLELFPSHARGREPVGLPLPGDGLLPDVKGRAHLTLRPAECLPVVAARAGC